MPFLPPVMRAGIKGFYRRSYLAPLAVAPPLKGNTGSGYNVTWTLPAETPRRVRLHPMSAQEREGDDRLQGRAAWHAFMRTTEGRSDAYPLGVEAGWRIKSNGVEYDVIDSNAGQTAPELERRLVVVRATQ